MKLSKQNLKKINNAKYVLPSADMFDLPEKVLQFGTGVLLRGLPNYFIDKANRQGIFNGRIVVVKSTSSGSTSAFDEQDNMYTLHVRGIDKGKSLEEDIVCSAISRVLSASHEWDEVLKCAHNPDLQIVISNTTEVGITLMADYVREGTPVSFPGKLLAFLYERYKAFGGSEDSGLVIVPTELIVDNGNKLKEIVMELAMRNNFKVSFKRWLDQHNTFCNSLVDRIVPGKPDESMMRHLEIESGYGDDLRIISEFYRLWAIQGDTKVAEILSFSKADEGVIIADDIETYRELKLRLLNGTHSLSCGIAHLAGFETVKAAMADEKMSNYIADLMIDEIGPSIPYHVEEGGFKDFAQKVLDRFKNPQLEHLWLSITLSYSAKLKMRVLPVLLLHYDLFKTAPKNIALGFAAYIRFMQVSRKENEKYFGESNGKSYELNDAQAALFHDEFSNLSASRLVHAVLKEIRLWDRDLSELPGFADEIIRDLNAINEFGMLEVLKRRSTVNT